MIQNFFNNLPKVLSAISIMLFIAVAFYIDWSPESMLITVIWLVSFVYDYYFIKFCSVYLLVGGFLYVLLSFIQRDEYLNLAASLLVLGLIGSIIDYFFNEKINN